jgi:hypothetical protein
MVIMGTKREHVNAFNDLCGTATDAEIMTDHRAFA